MSILIAIVCIILLWMFWPLFWRLALVAIVLAVMAGGIGFGLYEYGQHQEEMEAERIIPKPEA